jgi:hypothetical protein
MPQYSDVELDTMFDPTAAPAWDRVNSDEQQMIQAVWKSLRNSATDAVNSTPDDDAQSRKIIDSLKEAALKAFDAAVPENLNEPETGTDAEGHV